MIDTFIGNLSKNNASKIAEWKSDKELSQLIMSEYSKVSIKEAENWIEKNSSDYNQRLCGIFINNKEGQKEIIGITRLMFIDTEAKTCELGMYIGSQNYRGLGIGKKALQLTLSLAFKTMNMNKVYLKVKEDNTNAIKLYRQIGFHQEGILREHFKVDNIFEGNNIVLMALFNER